MREWIHGILPRQDLRSFSSNCDTRVIVGGQRLITTVVLSTERRRNKEMVHEHCTRREGRMRVRDGSRMEDDKWYETWSRLIEGGSRGIFVRVDGPGPSGLVRSFPTYGYMLIIWCNYWVLDSVGGWDLRKEGGKRGERGGRTTLCQGKTIDLDWIYDEFTSTIHT